MPRMFNLRAAIALATTAGLLCSCGALAAAADRPIAWIRSGGGAFERELAGGARRGLRLAAVSDGLPCSVSVLQAPVTAADAVDYRVVPDRTLVASLEALTAEGFVPVASTRTFGTRHEVVFERVGRGSDAGTWQVIEFERLDTLDAAVAAAAEEGFRVRLLVRPAFRSFPGLSEKGLLLAVRTGTSRDTRVLFATKKDVKELARDLTAATAEGWQFDVLFTNARDGGAAGRRERATVLLSRGRPDALAPVPLTIERRATFGRVGDVVVGAAAYWDEYLFVSRQAERRQAWATPLRVSRDDAECGALGFGFRFDAPRDQTYDVVALLARPVPSGGFEMLVVTNQRLGF